MGKFVIHPTNTGFKFNLKASNGETIAVSEIYKTLASCQKGAASVAKNAPVANVQDLTEGQEGVQHPKFELYQDKAGEFRFRLKATNGQIIAVSEGYTTKKACENGIESVRKNAADAPVVVEE
jgi:uncharacterized protein YegP (UPF0339 family)